MPTHHLEMRRAHILALLLEHRSFPPGQKTKKGKINKSSVLHFNAEVVTSNSS